MVLVNVPVEQGARRHREGDDEEAIGRADPRLAESRHSMAAYALCPSSPWVVTYRHVNKRHAELLGTAEWAAFLHEEILSVVTQGIDLGDDLLEIGPGPGAATWGSRRRSPAGIRSRRPRRSEAG